MLVRSVSGFRISVVFFNDDLSTNARTLFRGTFPTTAIPLLRYLCRDTPRVANHMMKFSNMRIFIVSPAYAKRFRYSEETEEQYVQRLRQGLEDKFLELGPDTVIGCKSSPTLILLPWRVAAKR